MKANFQALPGNLIPDLELDHHADWLASYDTKDPGWVTSRPPPVGFESYTCVDVMGAEFVWMNESFDKDDVTWYLWFESIFLVPKSIVPFLVLRWE